MNTAEKHPLTNYHSHTWRCQHAGGTEEEYVRQAIETGFSVLGFADHSPWPYASDFVSDMRMRLDQFADYERTVRGLAARYADRSMCRWAWNANPSLCISDGSRISRPSTWTT